MPVGQLIDMTVNRATNNAASEKPVGMIPLEPVYLGGAKPKKKPTWSSEVDIIAETEGYDKAMAPLITDMKDSVRDATNKAARTISEIALFAAPVPYIPGTSTAVKAIGGFANRIMNPIAKTIKPKLAMSHTISSDWPASKLIKHQLLPDLKKTTSRFAFYDPKQKEGLETWMAILGKGSETMKTARANEIKALSSGEGFKRLVNFERSYIDQAWRAQRGNITGGNLAIEGPFLGNLGVIPKSIKPSDFGAAAISNARLRIKELGVPSVNETAATLLNPKGKLSFSNFQKAQDLIMKAPKGTGSAIGSNYSSFFHNAFAHVGGNMNFSRLRKGISERFIFNEPKVALGTGNLRLADAAEHELGHVLQKGYPSRLDFSLINDIRPKSSHLMTPKNKLDYWYFTTGAAKGRVPRLTEAVPFAKEFRSILQQQNLIKNRYQKITPNLLYNIKNTLKSGESTRIYDFMKKSGDSGYTNIESLSKAMNKLPAFAPFIGFGGALGSGNK